MEGIILRLIVLVKNGWLLGFPIATHFVTRCNAKWNPKSQPFIYTTAVPVTVFRYLGLANRSISSFAKSKKLEHCKLTPASLLEGSVYL